MEYGLVAAWWVAYVGLWLFCLPVATRLCRSLPGRGAGFAFALSFAIFGFVGFWVGFLSLGWVAVFAGLLALAVCAVLSVRAGVDIDRRAAIEVLVVFSTVYLAVLAVRAVDPGITPAGEKFLDFGMMVSLYRAPQLPPEDFWFAGKNVIYYYGGHLLASLLTRLTGTHPWYGFNLSMAGVYAALAAGVYELAGSIAVDRHDSRSGTNSWSGGSWDRSRLVAGVTAVFFTIGAANLSTAARLLVRRLPSQIRETAASALASAHAQLAPEVVLSPIPEQYHYKIAGRIMTDLYNPFPLFAIVRGDLRPYVLSIPYLVVVAGLCYAYYRTPERAHWRRRGLVFGAIPVVASFIAVVNTWGLAVVAGLVWLTLTFAPASLRSLLPAVTLRTRLPDRPTDTPMGAFTRTAGALVLASVAVAVSAIASLPFFLGPVQARPSSPLVVLAASARSPLDSLLLIHGAFLAVFAVCFLARARSRWNAAVAAVGGVAYLALVLLVPGTLAPLALFVPFLAIGWYLLATDRAGFETVLVVAGFGLLLLAELVYLKPGTGGRFNTVVKTYMPTWVLWASATGVVLPRIVRGRREWSWDGRQVLAGALAALLVISTAAFGGVALTSHFSNPTVEEPTLDGMAAAENNIPGQVEAIEWLYDRPNRSTIVSAASPYIYRWSAAPAASLTGAPTVVGVPHEIQFRGRTAYFDRVRDVNAIYLGSDERRAALLDKYDVRYIYVGPTERARYGDIASFSSLRGVHIAFRAGTVTIYAVDQSRLSA